MPYGSQNSHRLQRIDLSDKRKTMGGYAVYNGVYGYISHKTQDGTRFWFTPFGDTENNIMFTPRSDGVHRAFPGPADGATITYVRKSQVPADELARHARETVSTAKS